MLSEEVRLAIRFVCSDMWKPYLNVIAEQLSNAVHVLDRFHIMKKMGEAIDEVRRGEARRLAQDRFVTVPGSHEPRSEENMTTVPLFVNGGGMRGGNVHHSIEGLPFLGEARTAPRYRFFSIRDEFPGLWPVAEDGVSVPGELYDVPLDVIRDRLIPAEPPELELSVIELDDGSSAVAVVLREVAHEAGTGLTDISEAGGWRAYRASA